MLNRRTILKYATAFGIIAATSPAVSASDKPVPVVATFSILGDMVSRIGGDHIALTTIVGPGGDAHVYQPTPADAGAVSEAQVLFVNGLEFEGWLDRLADASGFSGTRVVATDGLDPIPFEEEDHHEGEEHGEHEEHEEHEEGDHKEGEDDHADEDEHGHHHGAFDPHAWQSLANGEIYARNIAKALSTADPANAASYAANAEAYIAEMQALDAEILTMVSALPEESRTIVTSHDAFGYFAARYGLTFEAPQGLSTESEPSAADVAEMITQIRDENISAVFVESITDNRLLQQIANETGTTIGGTLYSDALSG
ncbi:MAG: zinc ABC transporter substrate-binding protein, partial [Pseudomonadota bacterium]